MNSTPLLWLLALASGALIPVQAASNAALSRSVGGNVPFAAMTLFLVAAAATALALLAAGKGMPAWDDLRAGAVVELQRRVHRRVLPSSRSRF